MTLVYGPFCDRTRVLIARQLDAPLSELERRAVAIHTTRCGACRAFERDSRWITEELRAARLDPLPRPVSITFPRRRLPMRVAANVASAAALVAVVLGGVAHVAQPGERPSSGQALPAPGPLDMRIGDPVLREIRRDGLRTGEIKVIPPAPAPTKPVLPATDG
jgi:anti-sigma factor RsiW